MKRKFLSSCCCLMLLNTPLIGQQNMQTAHYGIFKKITQSIEIIGGLSMNFPDDHGWSAKVYEQSFGKTSHEFGEKKGYYLGVGLVYPVARRFEVNFRAAFDEKGYREKSITTGDNNTIYSYAGDTRINYLSLSGLPTYFVHARRRLFVVAGFSYCKLLRSLRKETLATNGQVTQVSMTAVSNDLIHDRLSTVGGFGYNLNPGKTINIIFQLLGEYGITDTVDVNGLRITTNSFGVNISIRYNQKNLNNEKHSL